MTVRSSLRAPGSNHIFTRPWPKHGHLLRFEANTRQCRPVLSSSAGVWYGGGPRLLWCGTVDLYGMRPCVMKAPSGSAERSSRLLTYNSML